MTVALCRAVERGLERHGFDVAMGSHIAYHRRPHWHRGIEIALIHSGVVEVYVGDTSTTLLPGDAIIFSGETGHWSHGEFGRTVVHFLADMVPDDLRPFASDVITSRAGLVFQPRPHRARRILWAAHELASATREPDASLTAKALIGVMLADSYEALEQRDRCFTKDPLRDILSYMHHHVDGTETLDSVAERFGISRSYMTDLFKSHIGVSPGAYWLRVRLEHARALLVDGFTVEQVASRVGFQSARGIQRAFQRVFKMAPSEYRTLTSRRL